MKTDAFNHIFLGESALFFALLKSLRDHGLNNGPYVVVRHKMEHVDSAEINVLINGNKEFVIQKLPIDAINDFHNYLKRIDDNTIVEISTSTFETIYCEESNLVIISTCRNGLCDIYAPLLNNMHCSGTIISFDNDKTIAKNAKKMLPKFYVEAGMAHACSIKSYSNDYIDILLEQHVMFVFPSKKIRSYYNFFFPTPEIVFCESEKELQDYYEKKLIYINVPHTILTLHALEKEGISEEALQKKYLELSDIGKIHANTLNDCILIQNNLQTTYLCEDKNDWKNICYEFLLFTIENDKIERGLKWDVSTIKKLDKHLDYIGKLDRTKLVDVANTLKEKIRQSIN